MKLTSYFYHALASCLLFAVTADVLATVKVIKFKDFQATTSAVPNSLEFVEDLCVNNTQNTNYQIQIRGQSGQFKLTSEYGNTIPYQVYWYNSQGATGPGFQMQASQPETFSGAHPKEDCAGGYNATIKIKIDGADLEKSLAGHYNESVTVNIRPLG